MSPADALPAAPGNGLSRYGFLLGIIAVVALAALYPHLGAPGGPLRIGSWNWAIASALFLISGLVIRGSDVPRALADWRLHLFTQGFSLGVLPALFWLTAVLLAAAGLDRALCLGLIFLGALSTTTTSGVVLTRTAGGDEAGALFNATLGSVLGVGVSPALLLLCTGKAGSLPFLPMVGKLVAQVLIPLAAGQVLQWTFPGLVARWRPRLSRVSLWLLLVLVWTVMCMGFDKGFRASPGQLAAAALATFLLHACALGLAYSASGWGAWRFSRGRRTAALICSTQKSAALGMPLLLIAFAHDPALGLIALPLLIYHPLQMVAASLMAPALERWNRAGDPRVRSPAGRPAGTDLRNRP
jgi:solute carrier family 10 (sodium/bile acid cotransporter), member 7